MKAVLVMPDRHLCYTEVPDPVLRAGEVLVKIHAAALNRADLMQREGNYPPPEGCPEWMGLEISGEIAELSPEAARRSDWKKGDRVCALLGGGGYAEYAAVPYDMLMPIPEGCSMEEAAAMPEAYATAYLNLVIEGNLRPGDTLLMHAGASGLASVLIPMAKALGARVITTVLSAEIGRSIAHLGADIVVDTSRQSIQEVLREQMEQGNAVDIAIDCLGGPGMGECLPFLSYGARWIMIATLAGDLTQIDMRNIYVKNIRIIGSTLRSKAPKRKAEILASLVKNIWPLVEQGKIKPTVYRVLPITKAEEAHDILYRGENVGKVVLRVE